MSMNSEEQIEKNTKTTLTGGKLLTRIDKTVAGFVYSIIAFMLIAVGVMMFAYIVKYPSEFSVVEIFFWFPVAVVYTVGLYFFAKRLVNAKDLTVIVCVLCGASIIYLILLLTFDSQPASDWGAVWYQAQRIADGTFDGADKTNYLYYYNWQLGMAVFEAGIIKVFGAHFVILKILNFIILNLISFMTYIVAKRTVGRTAAIYAFVFTAFYIPYLTSVGQFTNHQVSLLLILLAVYLISLDKFRTTALSGAVLGVMNVFRPMAIVILIALFCLTVWKLISNGKRKDVIIKFVSEIACFVVVIVGFNVLFIKLGYTDMPVSSARLPYFKFDKGLNGYLSPVDDLERFGYDYDAFNAWEKDNVISALKNPFGTAKSVIKKMLDFTGTFNWQLEMSYNHDKSIVTAYPVKALYSTSWFTYLFLIIAAGIGYFYYRREHKRHLELLPVIFIGLILVHIFIEAFSSYRYEAYPFLLLMAGCFAANKDRFVADMKKFREKRRNAEAGGENKETEAEETSNGKLCEYNADGNDKTNSNE